MQFDRVISLAIQLANPYPATDYKGTIEIKNLRISFSILKSQSWSTNTAVIRVWNLSDSNRKKLVAIGDQIRLEAGYVGETGAQLLFLGSTTQLSHVFDQPDIISVLEAGDGEKSINNTLISTTWAARTTAKDILKTFADKVGLKIVTEVQLASITSVFYEYSYSFTGLVKDGIDIVCKKLNLTASVQNGNLVILPNSVGNLKPPYEVNLNTGMIGVPQRFIDKRNRDINNYPKPGWRVRTLLRPDIIPGDRIHLKSKLMDVDGLFYVLSIRHDGDNYGSIFESNIEMIAV